jgi:hypothetical protein
MLSSIVVDYAVRQKAMNITYFVLEQAPILTPKQLTQECYWLGDKVSAWLRPRALELFYTSVELEKFAADLGQNSRPFKWDNERRSLIQAEVDAAMFHLYGLDKDQADWILDSFTVLRKYEERDHGEFRTKRLVMAAYEAMAEAKEQGTAYVTPLSPPPADPKLCHPTTIGSVGQIATALLEGAWARKAQQPNDAGVALTGILKVIDGPKPSRAIRLAAALILEPYLLTPLLREAQAREWQRLVGQEAEPRTGNVVGFAARANQGWGIAVSNHRGNGRLIENLSEGTWAPGPGLDAFDTAGWPDGRAGFVLEALRQLDLDQTVTSMPDEVRGWITHAAAA